MQETLGKNWLEVALNGPWTKTRQPGIPVSVADIVEQAIACVKAGASIVHVYSYDESTCNQKDDFETYTRIIEGIRSQVDAIVYPGIPGLFPGRQEEILSAEQRYEHIESLAAKGLLEWIAIDPGSTNVAHYDDLTKDQCGFVYLNSETHVRHGMEIARRYGLHPSYAVYEPGFVRLGANLHWRESCPDPVYRFMFTRGFTFGFPPEDYALTAYLNLIDQVAPGANWMIAGFDVDMLPMIPRTVMERGHVRVGLGDAPFGSEHPNVELVEHAARRIENAGGALATATDVRIASSPDALEANG